MVPKDVIFVIDISGSMIGTKIKQVTTFSNQLCSPLHKRSYNCILLAMFNQ